MILYKRVNFKGMCDTSTDRSTGSVSPAQFPKFLGLNLHYFGREIRET